MSDDTRATLRGLKSLGYDAKLTENEVYFSGVRAPQKERLFEIDCANSGTSLRFLTALVAHRDTPVILTGDESLTGRPNEGLLNALQSNGVACKSTAGRAPLVIQGPPTSRHFQIESSASSQFASGIALALSADPAAASIEITGKLASRPYFEMTVSMLNSADVEWVKRPDGRFWKGEGQRLRGLGDYSVEADWSSAAFMAVGSCLIQKPVHLKGLKLSGLQGDEDLVRILKSFGQGVEQTAEGMIVHPQRCVSPGVVNLESTPDLFPALCVLASRADRAVHLVGCPQLRYKESDRILSMAEGLQALGIHCIPREDGLSIVPGDMRCAQVNTNHDHRIYMAFALIEHLMDLQGLVEDSGLAEVSYPGFLESLRRLQSLSL